ncbi:type II toxin-antitoxin system RelE/ParE family toxin [Cyclobacterium salsum]|uniref:type II toxin-antitoxin system RelE/ParE family toxin n=1 Tax=Cyclobacterium salsum TaxID=2666329 RepID=UPI001390C327|nr:type II toxin-antitoxin system RelE/ParE family toxin [Cyclobacterium salsum]
MKKVQVIWTDESLGDLEAIYDFLVAKSPQAAKMLAISILARTRQLETFPESGSPQDTDKTVSRSYRYLVEGNYKIIYSVEGKAVYVEAVVATRQDPAGTRV